MPFTALGRPGPSTGSGGRGIDDASSEKNRQYSRLDAIAMQPLSHDACQRAHFRFANIRQLNSGWIQAVSRPHTGCNWMLFLYSGLYQRDLAIE